MAVDIHNAFSIIIFPGSWRSCGLFAGLVHRSRELY